MLSLFQSRATKAFLKISALSVAIAGLTACGGDDDEGDLFFESDNTVADIVVEDDRFDTLEAALTAANLVDALEAPADTFTVFAPTDDAFDKIPAEDLNALLANQEALSETLLFHVVQGKELNAAEIIAAAGTRLETMSGKYIDIKVMDDGDDDDSTNTVMVENSLVTITNIEADNGIIHVIDTVLMPEDNIVEIASATDSLSTLVSAVVAAELVDTLSDEAPGFTVFAPNNDAFAAVADTVNPLLATINDDDASDDDKAEARATLQSVLTYHVLPMQVDAAAAVAAAGTSVTTVNGKQIDITTEDGNVFINGVEVIATDISASNGVVHVLEGVLLPENNIVETAVADGRFTTLVSAVTAAGLVDTLSDEEARFTVFAPTDDAFDKLNEDTLTVLLDEDNVADLQALLTYHVLEGEVASDAALALDGMRVETVNGKRLSVSVEDGNLFIDDSQVIITDIETSNGIIHAIDTVLMPKDNLVEIAQGDDRFETLVAAVVAADLVDTLSNESGTFTLFAPTDDAFDNLPDGTLDSLLLPENKDQLVSILTYHVLDSEVDAATALTLDGQTAETVEGSDISISVDGDMIDINSSNVIEADIMGSNGIIHVIDAVLLPPSSDES